MWTTPGQNHDIAQQVFTNLSKLVILCGFRSIPKTVFIVRRVISRTLSRISFGFPRKGVVVLTTRICDFRYISDEQSISEGFLLNV